MKKILLIFATGFGSGFFPKFPGTIGSLLALLIYIFFVKNNGVFLGIIILLILPLGIIASNFAEKFFKEKDSPKITIDEIIGMFLTFFLLPFNKYLIILGFLIFRLLDIIKLFPLKKIEKLKGGIGVVIDDVIAALYTNLILQIISKIL